MRRTDAESVRYAVLAVDNLHRTQFLPYSLKYRVLVLADPIILFGEEYPKFMFVRVEQVCVYIEYGFHFFVRHSETRIDVLRTRYERL